MINFGSVGSGSCQQINSILNLHDLPAPTETITDRLAHPTAFEYDERGNGLRKTDAKGGVTSFTYDDNDNVLTEQFLVIAA